MGAPKQKQENPALQKLITNIQGNYQNPDGTWKTAPKVDPYSDASQGRMDQLIAPQSQDTLNSYQKVRDGVGAWQGGMDDARALIKQSGDPTGQKIDFQGGGWTTGPDGKAQFSYDDAYSKSYNQYTDQVVGNTLSRLGDTFSQQRLADQDRAIKAGSFGGSRQGVQGALTNEMHQRAAAEAAASGYHQAHESALGNIKNLYGMGSDAVTKNNAVDSANADRQFRAGTGLSEWEKLAGQFRAGDANALNAIGKDQQAYDQSRRDALFAESDRDFWTPAQIGSMLMGAQSKTGNEQGQEGGLGQMLLGAGLQALPFFFSDERAKKDIKDANPDKALIELRQIAPKTYAYTDDAIAHGAPEGRRTGFMAQDLEAATGEPSPEMPGGYKGVDVAEQIGRLTQAVIALDRKVSGAKSKAA